MISQQTAELIWNGFLCLGLLALLFFYNKIYQRQLDIIFKPIENYFSELHNKERGLLYN